MPRASDVFAGFKGMAYSPRDADFYTTCTDCQRRVALSQATRAEDVQQTACMCPDDGRVLVEIRAFDESSTHDGWRLGEWVVFNEADRFWQVPGKEGGLRFEARARPLA
jgi:hypothetical protein